MKEKIDPEDRSNTLPEADPVADLPLRTRRPRDTSVSGRVGAGRRRLTEDDALPAARATMGPRRRALLEQRLQAEAQATDTPADLPAQPAVDAAVQAGVPDVAEAGADTAFSPDPAPPEGVAADAGGDLVVRADDASDTIAGTGAEAAPVLPAAPLLPGRRGRRREAEVVEVHPPATAARIQLRHRGLMLSFVLAVLLPFVLSLIYLWGVAQDQYASTVGFTVRREESTTSAASLLGGLAQFAGGSSGSETDILYEFIQSQEIVADVDERIGLGQIYATHWPRDPVFALWPDATVEDLQWFWQRQVQISYDASTRLMELRVLAPEADQAQRIAVEIVGASQRKINALNDQSRGDTMRYATEDLTTALARLKTAREALSRFRTRTQIVDPSADLQGRMGVLNNLQQQLAQALIDNDIVLGTTQETDPRREQAARRIQVIRDRIAAERSTIAAAGDTLGTGGNYPELLAEFESLTVDLQFAEESYRAALAAYDAARANASRQTLYLATYVNPTLPQVAEYPRRFLLAGLIGLFLTLGWSIMALVYYSVRDRR